MTYFGNGPIGPIILIRVETLTFVRAPPARAEDWERGRGSQASGPAHQKWTRIRTEAVWTRFKRLRQPWPSPVYLSAAYSPVIFASFTNLPQLCNSLLV